MCGTTIHCVHCIMASVQGMSLLFARNMLCIEHYDMCMLGVFKDRMVEQLLCCLLPCCCCWCLVQ